MLNDYKKTRSKQRNHIRNILLNYLISIRNSDTETLKPLTTLNYKNTEVFGLPETVYFQLPIIITVTHKKTKKLPFERMTFTFNDLQNMPSRDRYYDINKMRKALNYN